ncbi:C1q-related factor-like [Antennarius striatus]|uniref:C1q-related factor-like n=1 Tax=Antennarius striatus TaxID=241820 RepID=UPI0035B498A8
MSIGSEAYFTAVADLGGNFGPFPEERTLVFNTEITNIGGHYDCTSGIFKAPVPGYYYFTFFYHAGKQHQSGLTLMKDHEVIVRAFDNNQKGAEFSDNAGNAAFLQLDRGDNVFVHLPANCHVYASKSTTSFSGFLITIL